MKNRKKSFFLKTCKNLFKRHKNKRKTYSIENLKQMEEKENINKM